MKQQRQRTFKLTYIRAHRLWKCRASDFQAYALHHRNRGALECIVLSASHRTTLSPVARFDEWVSTHHLGFHPELISLSLKERILTILEIWLPRCNGFEAVTLRARVGFLQIDVGRRDSWQDRHNSGAVAGQRMSSWPGAQECALHTAQQRLCLWVLGSKSLACHPVELRQIFDKLHCSLVLTLRYHLCVLLLSTWKKTAHFYRLLQDMGDIKIFGCS